MAKPRVTDVLAMRYASEEMARLWSPEHKVRLERQLWVAVLQAQKDLGIDVPEGVIEAYRAVLDQVDLTAIAERERVTKHDVKARIEEFNHLAGFEHVHKGMTSRDLTENVEQLQIRDSLRLVRVQVVATLARLGQLATQYESVALTGRSHNVPAQVTTLGKRFASAADELLVAYARLEELLTRYPHRAALGFRQRAHLGGAGVPAFTRSRGHESAGADRGVTVVARAHHPPDGRTEPRDRGLQARPGRFVGNATQDEYALL